jgi:hypothetical protein
MENAVPSPEEIRALDHLNDADKADIIRRINEVYQDFPANNSIAEIIRKLGVGMANTDLRFTEVVLTDLIRLLDMPQAIRNEAAQIRQSIRVPAPVPNNPAPPRTPVRPAAAAAAATPVHTPSFHTPRTGRQQNVRTPQSVADKWDGYSKAQKYQILKKFEEEEGKDINMPKNKDGTFKDSSKVTVKELDRLYGDYMNRQGGQGFHKMQGKGLVAIRKDKKSITHLMDKSFDKPKPYTQFGRYFINKRRLFQDCVVMFRQPSGNTIGSLPSQKVSSALAHVFQTLVNNQTPPYESISNLSDAEKDTLAHVCRVCHVESPSLPKNSKVKSTGQQEEDKFNILRGEIIAGNDSPKIAKELKALLLKFMNEGRIPKHQANEILQELLVMGH